MSRIFICSIVVQLSVYTLAFSMESKGQSQSVYDIHLNLKVEDQSLKLDQVLSEIENETGFKFSFIDQAIDATIYEVILNKKETILANVLVSISEQTDLSFRRVNNNVFIKKDKTGIDRVVEEIQSVISGRVVDEAGLPLPGANILEKGTTNGTITNVDGNYTLKVADDAVLIVTFIGYKSQEVSIGGRSTVDFNLELDMSSLDEVVVVGYGTQKRKDVTGSVASISDANIKDRVYTSSDQALQGQVSGVQMTQSSSAPGGNASVRIRGGNSISAGNEPLYVIDGFPIYNDNSQYSSGALSNGQPSNVMASISPNDIASIEVLKDASATAIYGSRGANGVIIITTKRGGYGQSSINFESYYGFQQVTRKIPLLNNAPEYARLYNEQQQILGRPEPYADPSSFTGGTDWQDAAFRSAAVQNYQLSFSGGDDKTKYYLSGSYFDQDGIVKGSGFQRGSVRINLDRTISSKMKIGTSVSISRTSNSQIKTDTDPANNGTIGSISSIINVSPTEVVYDADGNYSRFFAQDGNFYVNPIASLLEVVNQSNTNRIVGNLFAEYEFVEGLTARVSLGGDQINVKQDFYQPASILDVGAAAVAKQGFVQSFSWLNENTLTYKKVFAQKHSLTSVVGFTRQSFRRESAQTGAQGFVNDILQDNSLNSGSLPLPPSSGVSEWALQSYIGRVNYGFNDKYLLTLTGRMDGSSRFGASNKYSFFPSGSLAWRVIEEGFMQNQKVVSDLKLRTSYGKTGNQEIPQYRSLAALGNSNYPLGNVVNAGLTPIRVSNPDLKWETTSQFDVGIDVGFLTNRIKVTADLYNKRTNDLLLDVVIPGNSGFTSALQNVGSVENKGFELAVNTVNVDREFTWETSFNITFNKNKVLDLGGDIERPAGQASPSSQIPNSGILRVGEPVGSFFGYVTDGLFQTQEEIDASAQPSAQPGDRKYKNISDENSENVIDSDDRVILGCAQPKFFYGFTNRFAYKGLDLSIFFQGVEGNSLLNLAVNYDESNNVAEASTRWSTSNTNTDIPRRVTEHRITDKLIEDGSFLRLRNVTLGYNLPINLISSIHLRSARVYVSAQNLLTITKYRGYDPEVSSFGQDNLSIGVDRGGYPVAKTITFGINIGL